MLGTPPAFILSQDRTLWKMFIHGHSLSYWLISVLCPVSILTVFGSSRFHETCKEFSRSNVFHCSVINVPFGFALASAATLIGYQTFKSLSITFFIFFKLFFNQNCFKLITSGRFTGCENDNIKLKRPLQAFFYTFFNFSILHKLTRLIICPVIL